MGKLRTDSNMTNPDDFYAALLALHEGRTAEESAAINAKLVLLLANQIGDIAVLREALQIASASGESGKPAA